MTHNKMSDEQKLKKTREIVMVRGIAGALQAMESPTVSSLNNLLLPYGFQIVTLSKLNQPDNNGNTNDENVG